VFIAVDGYGLSGTNSVSVGVGNEDAAIQVFMNHLKKRALLKKNEMNWKIYSIK
jgi:hypothetical protein